MHTKRRFPIASLTTLALWLVRQTWSLLLITGVGILAAVLIVCSVPLYANVASTAGLRAYLRASPVSTSVTVRSDARLVSSRELQRISQQIDHEVRQNLGTFVKPGQFSLHAPNFNLMRTGRDGLTVPGPDYISFIGADINTATPHIQLLQGRLPQKNTQALEIMLRPDAAKDMNVTIGANVSTQISLISDKHPPLVFPISLQVVGIFKSNADDIYWHGETFTTSSVSDQFFVYQSLVSNDALVTYLERISSDPQRLDRTFESVVQPFWYYQLDIERMSTENLESINNAITLTRIDNSNNPVLSHQPYTQNSDTFLPNDEDATFLSKYLQRTIVANVPVSALLVLILALLLFFVSIMTTFLIERRAEAIAILRSRGASRLQILTLFLLQGIGLCILALLLGPLLALLAVDGLAHLTLSAADRDALNLLWNDPISSLVAINWLPLLVIAASLATMGIALARSLSRNLLTLRRERARSRARSILQWLGFDGIAALFSLIGFAFSSYILSANVLDAHLRSLLYAPLSLFEVIFLALAVLLLLMRLFTFLLQFASSLLRRNRGATVQLALTHMARAPREPIRMTMLLSLSIAFAIFTLIFLATQTQRVQDISLYRTGADFVGRLTVSGDVSTISQLDATTHTYKHLRGVSSATLGYTDSVESNDSASAISVSFTAADADTFANTARWSEQNSSQPLPALMQLLRKNREQANDGLPAIVDDTVWQQFHLTPNAHFGLRLPNVTYGYVLNLIAVAHVHSLPSVGGSTNGGVLTDYRSFLSSSCQLFPDPLSCSANTVWVRTWDDMASIQSVQQALSEGDNKLVPLYDRRGMVNDLSHEQLYAAMFGAMALGGVTALLLALVGNLVGAWFRVYTRQTNFAVLRALGATTQQIGIILTWEQGIISLVALLVGAGLGALVSTWMLPLLIFTDVAPQNAAAPTPSDQLYSQQTVPPIHIVVPSTLLLALFVIIVLCLLALFLMVRVGTAPKMSQKLRLNED